MAEPQVDELSAKLAEESEVLPPALRARYTAQMEGMLKGSSEPGAATEPPAPQQAAPEQVQEPAHEPAQEAVQEPAQEPVQEPAQEPVQEPAWQAELQAMREELRRAQARYDTLRGKYDAEIAMLRQQLAGAASAPAPARTSAPDPTRDQVRSFREVLAAQYGQEFDESTIDFVARAAALAHERAVAALQDRLTATEQRANITRQQALELQLDARIPGWREIASDPQFAQWLDEVDPFSGLVRREVLAQAVERADADRLGVVFETYRRALGSTPVGYANGAGEPTAAPAGAPRVAGAAPSPKPRLPPSAAVAPPRPRGPVAATSASTASPVTSADLRAYAERARRGEATDEEFRRLRDAMLSGQYTG